MPNNSRILELIGSACYSIREYKDAAAYLKESIKANPNNDNTYNTLSVALHKIGKDDEAIKWLNAGLEINPTNTSLIYNLSSAHKSRGNISTATKLLKSAIRLNPGNADALNNLGLINQECGKTDDAIHCFQKALEIRPKHPDANFNLGNIYYSEGRFKKAINSFHIAIKSKQIFPGAYNNLGMSHIETGNLELARKCYEIALAQRPNYPEALNNLGNTLEAQGEIFTATILYKKAISINQNYSEAIKNLGMAELSIGDYKNGWEHYEQRFKCSSAHDFIQYIPQCKRWNGSKMSKKEPLWIICEQGLGDTIQFMRYIKLLKSRGYLTFIGCTERLHSLIQACDIDNSPLTLEEIKDETIGQWIPLLSIPKYLEVGPKNPIVRGPYIKTTVDLTRKWQRLLNANQRPIVGIHWQGNPSIEKGSLSGRSLPLESFKKLSSFKEISLLSLQKGPGSEQFRKCTFKHKFVSCQNQVDKTWDFLETAAIIQNCILVITNDSAIAHLSGGLGKKTWLLLHKTPEWRWGLESSESFWYSNMSLFRQRQNEEWEDVIERVYCALSKEIQNSMV